MGQTGSNITNLYLDHFVTLCCIVSGYLVDKHSASETLLVVVLIQLARVSPPGIKKMGTYTFEFRVSDSVHVISPPSAGGFYARYSRGGGGGARANRGKAAAPVAVNGEEAQAVPVEVVAAAAAACAHGDVAPTEDCNSVAAASLPAPPPPPNDGDQQQHLAATAVVVEQS